MDFYRQGDRKDKGIYIDYSMRISQMMWNSLLGGQGLLTALEAPEKILKPVHSSQENVVPINKTVDPE